MEEKLRTPFLVTEELLASHSQRFINLLLDTVAEVFLFFGVLVFIAAQAEATGDKAFMTGLPNNTLAQYTITTVITLLYYNIFEIFTAKTIGKLVTQTLVVDVNGEKPDHETILIRSLCRLIPFNALSIIGFPARTWHDRISKTYVVDQKKLIEKKEAFKSMNATDQAEQS